MLYIEIIKVMDLDVLPNAQCTQFHGKWAEKDRNFGVTLMIEPVFMRATREGVKIIVVLFGLVHIIGMDFSIISSLLVLIAGTMVGIMFSMVAIESGSVWNSGIVHSLWNILIIGGGLSISEKADEYSVMTYVLDSKDFVFTGGEFGIESSIIALLGYVIVTLAAICMIKKKAKV